MTSMYARFQSALSRIVATTSVTAVRQAEERRASNGISSSAAIDERLADVVPRLEAVATELEKALA